MPRWQESPKGRAMRVITINLTEHQLEVLETLRIKGIAPSRSELIRLALNFGLPSLVKMVKKQKRVVQKCKTSTTPLTPSDKIFVENGDGTFQKYKIVGEA